MKERTMKKLLLSLISVLLVEGCSVAQKSTTIPQIWDMKELQASKSMAGKSNYSRSLVKNSSRYLADEPITVTTKSRTFAPNNHYYCSIGPYWWPDEEHPGKYINRDGRINPESRQYDRDRLIEMTKLCQELSKAFYVSGERDLYYAFVRQLKACFIDEETYMYPNFEYSQVIPGRRENRGRSTGMVDAYYFNTLIESIRLVNSVKKIDTDIMDVLQLWFGEFARWADEGVFGDQLRKANNNVGLAFDVTIANMYLFSGNETRAKEIVDRFAEQRINVQILDDGSQPAELKRTNSFGYSLFNLEHIVDMCYLARYWYPNYYQEHKEKIDKAFAFLGQYVENPKNYPYQQVSGWDNCKKNYDKQLERIQNLNNPKPHKQEKTQYNEYRW